MNDGRILIRGLGTSGGSSALVLIDGMEGQLESIGIPDIESIDIFKGPETSLFGMRGSNGVISITTYSVVIESLTADGRIIRRVETIEVK